MKHQAVSWAIACKGVQQLDIRMPPSVTFLVAETCLLASALIPLRWVRGSCPKIATKLARINNCGYACANLLFLPAAVAVLLPHLLHEETWSNGLPLSERIDVTLGIYFYSKAWEFLDIALVSLMGIQPNLHFMVHHVSTPCLAWLIWTFRSASGALFLQANVLMHIVLYAYFGGARSQLVLHFTRVLLLVSRE